MGQINLFRNNHCLLGLLDLPVMCWFSKMSDFLPVWSSLCPSLIWYICITFFRLFACCQKYTKIRACVCWKRHKKWTFRFFEKFYHLNLLEMILTHETMELLKLTFFLWLDSLRANQLILFFILVFVRHAQLRLDQSRFQNSWNCNNSR